MSCLTPGPKPGTEPVIEKDLRTYLTEWRTLREGDRHSTPTSLTTVDSTES